MASQFDDSDFIDREFQSSQAPYSAAPGPSGSGVAFRPPTREELDVRVGEAQQKLAELRRAQEELERERAALEEARRRRHEFQTGRDEMRTHLMRGVTLMEKAELDARRSAEQMSKTLVRLREALAGIEEIHEETWNEETWNAQLTKALATIENARMEWSRAQLAWSLLSGKAEEGEPPGKSELGGGLGVPKGFWQLCKLGFALTWPVALVGLIAVVALLILRSR